MLYSEACSMFSYKHKRGKFGVCNHAHIMPTNCCPLAELGPAPNQPWVLCLLFLVHLQLICLGAELSPRLLN